MESVLKELYFFVSNDTLKIKRKIVFVKLYYLRQPSIKIHIDFNKTPNATCHIKRWKALKHITCIILNT